MRDANAGSASDVPALAALYDGIDEVGMSIKAITWVWDNSEAQGTELLCMLALADYANDEGEAYPGIQRLAHRCRVGERAIQKVISKLVDLGEIEVIHNQGIATSTGKTNLYKLTKYAQGVNVGTPLKMARGERGDTPGVNVGTPLGVNGGSPDPSVLTISDPSDKKILFAAQTPAPELAKKETKHRKEAAYVNPATNVSSTDVMDEYKKLLMEFEPNGGFVYAQEASAAKELAKLGWAPVQVGECYRHMKKDAFWKSKHLSLWGVVKQIGAYYAKSSRKPIVLGGSKPVKVFEPVDPETITF